MTATGARRIAVAALAALAVTTGGAAIAIASGAGADDSGSALGPEPVTITLEVNHSRFTPGTIDVEAGTRVTFVVRNHDPINHELIVGDEQVHARHEQGTEEAHPPVPGEVSVGPGETARTTYVFDEPGDILFACHLPGHFDYGMHGTVRVRT